MYYVTLLTSKPKGIATVLVPGGAFEARNWSKGEVKLYLNKRKGFIKLALRFGVDLVPSFSFNEQFIYSQLSAEEGNYLLFHLYLRLPYCLYTTFIFNAIL